MIKILNKHIKQISDGGLIVFLKKIKSLCILIFQLPIYIASIPIIIIIRILKPFYLIRWRELYSSRIGHFAKETELHLSEAFLDKSYKNKKILDIFFLGKFKANNQLVKMWKRRTTIIPRFFMVPLFRVNNFLNIFFPSGKDHEIKWKAISKRNMLRDIFNVLEKTKPNLSFTDEEHILGKKFLKQFGLNEKDKFVCLIVRDSAYLSTKDPQRDWSYHDYRNSDIENYFLAAEELTKKGYFVFRMGTHVSKQFHSKNKMIIDYANSNLRSDFMDIYLSAHCKFAISTATGLDEVTCVFRKPILYTNVAPLAIIETHNSNSIILFKEYFSNQSKNKLTLKEILDQGLSTLTHGDEFNQRNIKLIDNSPQDILQAVIEMDEKIELKWINDQSDLNLQSKFWEIFKNNKVLLEYQKNRGFLHGEIKSKISSNFLKKNKYLLSQ